MLNKSSGCLQDSLIAQAARDLPYHSATWQALVGELLVAGAEEVPRVPLEPAVLCAVLAPGQSERRGPAMPPIHQALYGARALAFGVGVYRPEHAGYNDPDDVRRLTAYLQSVEPDLWILSPGVDSEDMADAQAWWPELVGMYENAHRQGWLIVCEEP